MSEQIRKLKLKQSETAFVYSQWKTIAKTELKLRRCFFGLF
jgi:hypothetical protein